MNAFLSQLYPHILLQFGMFQLIFVSKNKFSCGAEFLRKSSRKILKRVGNTGKQQKKSQFLPLLPDGRIFGQISQKRPQKIIHGRKKLKRRKMAEFGKKWQK
jgi:hypothetical protein